MNTSKVLFNLLSILIFLVILAIVVGIVITVLSIMGIGSENLSFNGNHSIEDLTSTHFIFMGLNVIFYIVFIYGLFKLRTVAQLFLNNTFYDSELGKNCDLAGKSFILAAVFWWFFDGLSNMFIDHEVSIGVSDKTFIYLFIIAIGLFLMLTSKLFDKALELKSENDLTI